MSSHKDQPTSKEQSHLKSISDPMKPKNTQVIRPLTQAILCAAMVVGAALPFCPAASRAQSLEISVQDGGQNRRLELATDEVEIFRRGEGQAGKLKQTMEGKVAGAKVIEDHTTRVIVKLNAAYDRQRVAGGTDGFHAAVPDSEVSPVLYIKGAPRDRFSRRIGTRDALVFVGDAANAEQLRVQAGASAVVATPVDGVFKLKFPTAFHALDGVGKLTTQGVRVEPQLRKQYEKKAVTLPLDEFFPDQWHLVNTGQNGATPGVDVNVLPAWDITKGSGVTVAVVDDCLETTHPDLRLNAPLVSTLLHHDFNDDDDDPRPIITLGDRHGTAVGGLIGAAQNNGAANPVTGRKLGVSGVSPEVQLLGLRLISGPISDQDIYDAMTWGPGSTVVSVSNNSWGPPDGYYGLATPDILGKAGLRDAALQGRGGKGQVTVFAAGNGRFYEDDSNADGFANSRFVLAVAALNATGTYSSYSEPGANILVTAPGGGFGSFGAELRLTTTDVTGVGGYNPGPSQPANTDYTNSFNGTSSASPVTAGVASLVLATNPELGWRDVKEILASTAQKVDETNPDWRTNEGGFHFNHSYGAGLINAGNAVARAFTWQNLGSELKREIVKIEPGTGAGIPEDGASLLVNFDFTNVTKFPNLRLEQIEIETKITHPSRSDLQIALISPLGTRSILALPHFPGGGIDPNTDYRDSVIEFVNGRLIFRDGGWVFTSTHHWGENSAGVWKLEIIDTLENGEKGRLEFSALRLYGTASGTQRVAFETQRYSVIEPTGATTLLQPLVIKRTGGTAGEFSVNYLTTISPATAGQDFTAISGTVTFADGVDTQTIDLPILPDLDPEDIELVNIVLTNLNTAGMTAADKASFGGNTLVSVDIVDAENNKVKVVATDPDAAETNAELQPNTGKFTISRSKATSTSFDVFYSLSGNAMEGGQLSDDYAQLPVAGGFHIATIPAFQTSVDVMITPADDAAIEGTENVILTLETNGAGYDIGVPGSAIVNIVDNDRPVVQILATDDLAIETPVLPFPATGLAKFIVKRAPITANPLTVFFQFGGTQIIDTNYRLTYVDDFGATVDGANGVVIAPGQESVEVTLTPIDDDIYQATKTVIVSMLPNVDYDFSFGFLTSARFNIIENDPFPDTKVPLLSVTSPVNGSRFQVTDTITFTGSATDNGKVDRVIYRLNRGAWKILPGIAPAPAVAWSIQFDPLDMIVGFNTLDVKAMDDDGNESRTFSSVFKRIQLRSLTTTTSGLGAGGIKPVPASFEVGDLVKLQAIPAPGSIFGGWTGFTASSNRLLSFAMPDQDITMNADFGTNPFTPFTSGAYSGLVESPTFFFETTGFLNLLVGPTGIVTGNLTFSGVKYRFTGEFLSTGHLSVTIPRKNTSPIQLELDVDLDATDAGSRRATGTLTTASSVSSVTVDRAAYSTTVHAPAELVKSYTVILPPAAPLGNLFQDPRGYGVAKMKIDAKGLVKWKGTLPDGTVALLSQALTKDNTWPMFLSLYKNRGVLLGQMTMDTAPVDSDMNGTYSWFKPVLERDLVFPLGFKIEQNEMLGSIYTPPTAGRALLGFSDMANNATVTIAEGSLLVPIVKPAIYLPTNAITITTPGLDALKLKVGVKTGDLTGSFVHAVTNRSTLVKGVLFQKQQAAFSFFKGTSTIGVSPQTGYLLFEQAQ